MLINNLVLIYGIVFTKADLITSKLEAKQTNTTDKNNRSIQELKNDNIAKFTDFLQQALKILHLYDDSDLEYLFAVIGDEVRKSQNKRHKSLGLINDYSFRRFLANTFEKLKYRPAAEIRRLLKSIANKVENVQYDNKEKELIELINSLNIHGSVDKFKAILSDINDMRRKNRKNMEMGRMIRNGVRSAISVLRTEAQDYWNYFLQLALSQVMKFFSNTYSSETNSQRVGTNEQGKATNTYVDQILDLKFGPHAYDHLSKKHRNKQKYLGNAVNRASPDEGPTQEEADSHSTDAWFSSDEGSSMGETEELGKTPVVHKVSEHGAFIHVATMKPHKPKKIEKDDDNKSDYQVKLGRPRPILLAKRFNNTVPSTDNKMQSNMSTANHSVYTGEDYSIEELNDAQSMDIYRKMDKSNSVDIVTENNVIQRIADLEYDVKVIKTQIKNGSEIIELLNNKVHSNEVKLDELYYNQTSDTKTDDSIRRIFNVSIQKENGGLKTNINQIDGSFLDRYFSEGEKRKQYEHYPGLLFTRSKEKVQLTNNAYLNRTSLGNKLLRVIKDAEKQQELTKKGNIKAKTNNKIDLSKYQFIRAVDDEQKDGHHKLDHDDEQKNQEKDEIDTIILNSKVKNSKLAPSIVSSAVDNSSNTIISEVENNIKSTQETADATPSFVNIKQYVNVSIINNNV